MKKETFSPVLKSALQIAVLWTLIGVFQATYEFTILINYNVSPGISTYFVLLKTSMATAFMAGLLAGLTLLPLVNAWLRTHPYGTALLLSLLAFAVLYFVMSVMGSIIYNVLRLRAGLVDESIWPSVVEYLSGTENLKNFLFWLFVVTVTILALQINDKYGPGVLRAFIMGKYFRPKTEDRVFMFLDLRSSTTIAEQMEELQYFAFIKNFYKDATPGVLATRGEIYQYVGDEIVVSWPLPRGLDNNNCVHAFFEIRKSIQELAYRYEQEFGVVPSFKVGLHCGRVVTGEIGVIKRDLAYSGDVLNTTARIQSKCNELGVDILLSETLLQQLNLAASGLEGRPVGEVPLRGKARAVALYTVEMLER